MPNFSTHNAADAIQCLVEDIDSYIDGTCDPDKESHQCSRDNAILVQETLGVVRELGLTIERGNLQEIADFWSQLKPQIELHDPTPASTIV